MEMEVFKIKFVLNEEEGLIAKVNADEYNMTNFKEVFGIDLVEVFKGEKFNDCIDDIIGVIADEIKEEDE